MKQTWYLKGLILLTLTLAALTIFYYKQYASHYLPFAVSDTIAPAGDLPPGMELKTYTMPAGSSTPTIALSIKQHQMGDYVVHVTTNHFTFAPDKIDDQPAPGEGHIHLYIDNQLIILPSPWYHLTTLTPGTHSIRVALFNNDHSAYVADGKRIETSQTITVPTNQ